MLKIEWAEEFKIGNEYVDMQHQYFLDLVNRIGKAFNETDDVAYKRKLWSELYKYADFHFTSEENLAMSQDLQGIEEHHLIHLDLLEQLNQFERNIDIGLKTIDEFLEFIMDWFLVHSIHEDRKLFNAM